MRDKNIAGILAIFLGMFGAHRFYLGQKELGLFYLLFGGISFFTGGFFVFILMAIDAISFFSMGEKEFDYKYNRKDTPERRTDQRTQRKQKAERSRTDRSRPNRTKAKREYNQPRRKRTTTKRQKKQTSSPYKDSGYKKYKDFDYEAAIVDFEKAKKTIPHDISLRFNLACAYSLTENIEKALQNLDEAVSLGFNDFEKIKTHDAFAYIRIQPQFEEFESNNYQLIGKLGEPKEDLLSSQGDVLQQLNKLAQLKEKGLLTEDEFILQKEKILRK